MGKNAACNMLRVTLGILGKNPTRLMRPFITIGVTVFARRPEEIHA
jgi:hypothetical protein